LHRLAKETRSESAKRVSETAFDKFLKITSGTFSYDKNKEKISLPKRTRSSSESLLRATKSTSGGQAPRALAAD
jgi:hypothetical protein